MRYTYKDFVTGQTRFTCGKFKGFTNPTGPLNARYAIFQRPATSLFVPEYCLTKETKNMLPLMIKLEPGIEKCCSMVINGKT